MTSATLIQKIKTLSPGADDAAWVRFWDMYAGAIRQFAARKGGLANADDIVMTVLGKLVNVLRSGQYTREKGAFHSYLSTMILNEVHMLHRREMARKADMCISIDTPLDDGASSDDRRTIADVISPETISPDVATATADDLDEDWRYAILESATEHVLTRTAISPRDREVYRAYVQEERPIDEVAAQYGLSRNSVSQIKTRINRRIIDVGKELLARFRET